MTSLWSHKSAPSFRRFQAATNEVSRCETQIRVARLLVILILALPLGCMRTDSEGTSHESEARSSSLQPRDLESLTGTAWPDAPMPPARISITCAELDDQLILSLDRSHLEPLIEICASRTDFRRSIIISYDGEIGTGTADLFARINALAKEQPAIDKRSWPFALSINSSGGDAIEAMLAGEIIAEENWRAHIGKGPYGSTTDARCYSACVLLYAAATHRGNPASVKMWREWDAGVEARLTGKRQKVINDDTNLGIHRLFMVASDASSVGELQMDLDEAIGVVGDYLARHGVSRSLANDMMAIPSNDIRILSIDEVNRYGLGEINSAKADLERLGLIRACGLDYVARLDEYEHRSKQCWGLLDRTEAGMEATMKCFGDARAAVGLSEMTCPE